MEEKEENKIKEAKTSTNDINLVYLYATGQYEAVAEKIRKELTISTALLKVMLKECRLLMHCDYGYWRRLRDNVHGAIIVLESIVSVHSAESISDWLVRIILCLLRTRRAELRFDIILQQTIKRAIIKQILSPGQAYELLSILDEALIKFKLRKGTKISLVDMNEILQEIKEKLPIFFAWEGEFKQHIVKGFYSNSFYSGRINFSIRAANFLTIPSEVSEKFSRAHHTAIENARSMRGMTGFRGPSFESISEEFPELMPSKTFSPNYVDGFDDVEDDEMKVRGERTDEEDENDSEDDEKPK